MFGIRKLMAHITPGDVLSFIGEPAFKNKQTSSLLRQFYLSTPFSFRDEIYELANVSEDTRAMWTIKSCHPTFAINITRSLANLITTNCIYHGAFAADYYLELIEDGRLFVKYQYILGSRYLVELSPDDMVSLKSSYVDLLQAMFPDETGGNAIALNKDVIAEIAQLILDGNNIRLPTGKLAHYARIKVLLEQGGGKYGRGGVFTFPESLSAADLLEKLQAGNKVNHQQATQSFFTPREQGIKVCAAAGDMTGKRAMDPSAGDGALADIAKEMGADVIVIENFKPNATALSKKGYDVIERDFLSVTPEEIGLFDVIVANPPFTKNADIDHVMHMIKFLRPGGVLSTIMSTSWRLGSQKKQVEFANFLRERGAQIETIEAGAFKESGTMVETTHVVLTI